MSLTGLAFLLAFAVGIWLTVFRHPLYGLYTYIALFYLNPPGRWWGETLPDLRWSLVAGIVTLLAAWRIPGTPGRTPWHKTGAARVLILFTLWFWIQNLWALEPALHLEASFLFAKYVMLSYLIYRLVPTPADMWRFLLAHLAGCAYFGYLAFTAGSSGRLEGVGGPGIDEANAFAMHMSTGVVTGAMVALTATGKRRWFALGALPFILNGVVLSGSRGGFLALVSGGLVLWYLKPRSSRKLFYAFACLGVVLFGMLTRDPMFWERMQTIEAAVRPGEQEIDDSALGRLLLVDAQLKMAREYPFGTGHRGTATLSPRYLDDRFLTGTATKRSRSSHNTFLTALVEQGLPGAFMYCWLWGWAALTVARLSVTDVVSHDPEKRGLLAAIGGALVVVLIAGLFVDYIKTEVQIWLFSLLASLMAAVEPARARVGESGKRPA